MASKFCRMCGKALSEASNFCPACGSPSLSETAPPPHANDPSNVPTAYVTEKPAISEPTTSARKPSGKIMGLGFFALVIVIFLVLAAIANGGNGSSSDTTSGKLKILMVNHCSTDITVKVTVDGALVVNTVIRGNGQDSITISCDPNSVVYAMFKINNIGTWSSTQKAPGTWGEDGKNNIMLEFSSDMRIGCGSF